jgi:sulfur-oxidizing protein SoxX
MVSNDYQRHLPLKPLLAALLIATPVWAGDAENGRKIVEDRSVSACLLCHSGPFPAPHLQGNIGPSLDGVGGTLSLEQIKQHLTDPARFNPDTVMPAYNRAEGLNRVGPAWRGRPILTDSQIDDVAAFLTTLRGR